MEAIAKLLEPKRFELPLTAIEELIDKYHTRPAFPNVSGDDPGNALLRPRHALIKRNSVGSEKPCDLTVTTCLLLRLFIGANQHPIEEIIERVVLTKDDWQLCRHL